MTEARLLTASSPTLELSTACSKCLTTSLNSSGLVFTSFEQLLNKRKDSALTLGLVFGPILEQT